MSVLREMLEIGVELVNQEVNLNSFFDTYVGPQSRSMVLTVPETASQFGLLAIRDDDGKATISIVHSNDIESPTVRVAVPEELGFKIFCTVETLLTAYMKGYPVEIEGEFCIRDAKLLDMLMEQIYSTLAGKGYDLCQMIFHKPRNELIREATYGVA